MAQNTVKDEDLGKLLRKIFGTNNVSIASHNREYASVCFKNAEVATEVARFLQRAALAELEAGKPSTRGIISRKQTAYKIASSPCDDNSAVFTCDEERAVSTYQGVPVVYLNTGSEGFRVTYEAEENGCNEMTAALLKALEKHQQVLFGVVTSEYKAGASVASEVRKKLESSLLAVEEQRHR